MPERLISADSHVRITADSVRERLSAKVAAQYDDALKALAAEEDELRGGQSFGLGNFDLEGARDPGYWEPNARLAAMDRDGVEAEVLYSELERVPSVPPHPRRLEGSRARVQRLHE